MVVRIGWLSVVLTVLFAASSAAQPVVVDSFARLSEVLKPGNVVFVTDEKGAQTKGKVTELSPASMQLLTPGMYERTVVFPSERVVRVSKIDSRWNGFLIGTAIGAVPGLILAHYFNQYCKNETAGYCPVIFVYAGGATGLIGGWIGYGIDGAINGQTLVYARAPRPPGLSFSMRF
jgi:hypothetical protein